MIRRISLGFLVSFLAACGGSGANILPEYPPFEPEETPEETAGAEVEREAPPASGESRDVHFPPVVHRTIANGLTLDVIESHTLPVAHVTLLIASGSDSDPENLPGLSSFVADMLKEGTRRKTSAQLAEAFDAIGARYNVHATQESLSIDVSVLIDELPAALALVAEMVTTPAFDATELEKLKRRERARLTMQLQDPNFLARRAIRAELYGSHPYARIDTTLEAIDRLRREDLIAWQRANIVPANSTLIVAGDLDAAGFATTATRTFRTFRGGAAPTITFPAVPTRTGRTVIVVDRPGSVQSVIRVGNLAIPRNSPDYVPLTVANHVLGGGANSRLFVDLRERRGLTYGAYSSVTESTEIGPFAVGLAVRTQVTTDAVAGVFEHLERIVAEPVTADELHFAETYLSDSFPLQIDTPRKVVQLVCESHIFQLPEGYWDSYRSAIVQVTAEQALEAARRNVRPAEAVVIVVGESSAFAESLARFGAVRVVDVDGHVIREFAATPAN